MAASALPVSVMPVREVVMDEGNFMHVRIGKEEFIDFNAPPDAKGHSSVNRRHWADMMSRILKNNVGSIQIMRMSGVYPLSLIARFGDKIEAGFEEIGMNTDMPPISTFMEIARREMREIEEAFKERMARGTLESNDFPLAFPEGSEVFIVDGRHPIGGVVHKVKFHRGMFSPSYWAIDYKTIGSRGAMPEECLATAYVEDWPGVIEIGKLPIQMKKDGGLLDQLNERGAKFRAAVGGAKYLRYEGQIARSSFWGVQMFRADGRVMVDPRSFKVIDNNGFDQEVRGMRLRGVNEDEDSFHSRRRGARDDDETAEAFTINDADLWRCQPYVLGFSFRAKKWGRMDVNKLSEISYRGNAFQQLVMDDKIKRTIRALVQNSAGSFSDIIDGKGGGTIFLLEGEPGQGKTLTAETVAEDLRKPLYAVSVGELGTDPDQLEDRMRQILDIATSWDAVLLLDEADIFLEARDSKDIMRNAMVGVLLRLLEYHQGVLFLTTNRANNIDRAFFSRISLAISFPEATPDKRKKVWNNLLNEAGLKGRISDSDIVEFAGHNINGRQIKNAIRQSQTIAKSENRAMVAQDIRDTIKLGQAFSDKLARQRSVFYRIYDWSRSNLRF